MCRDTPFLDMMNGLSYPSMACVCFFFLTGPSYLMVVNERKGAPYFITKEGRIIQEHVCRRDVNGGRKTHENQVYSLSSCEIPEILRPLVLYLLP